MKYFRLGFLVVTLIAVVTGMGLIWRSIGQASQNSEKSLDIERHGNEPFEFVDLKVSGKSLKGNVKVKFRRGDDGFDNAKFHDTDDWAKRVQVRLRNVSGKTIVGFQAYLYLKPAGSQVLFSVSLTGPKHLEETSLAPGDEIEAEVDAGSWERAIARFMAYGGELNSAEISLSVGIVGFSDGLQRHKGHTLRTDPDNPNRRIPIETKGPPGVSRLSSVDFPNTALAED